MITHQQNEETAANSAPLDRERSGAAADAVDLGGTTGGGSGTGVERKRRRGEPADGLGHLLARHRGGAAPFYKATHSAWFDVVSLPPR